MDRRRESEAVYKTVCNLSWSQSCATTIDIIAMGHNIDNKELKLNCSSLIFKHCHHKRELVLLHVHIAKTNQTFHNVNASESAK